MPEGICKFGRCVSRSIEGDPKATHPVNKLFHIIPRRHKKKNTLRINFFSSLLELLDRFIA